MPFGKRTFMVGAFPPPVQGMAVINDAMARVLSGRGRRVDVLNVAAIGLARGVGYHVSRVLRSLRCATKLAASACHGSDTVYMSVSGGNGQGYDLIFALLARVMRLRLTLHHHSFAYLETPSRLTRLLIRIAPTDTMHVVLSRGMEERLRLHYGVRCTQVLSNAAFMPSITDVAVPDRPLRTLGFLSNISREKGIFDFIGLMDACRDAGLDVKGVIAGPFQDRETEAMIMPLVRNRADISYIGPQYGEAKILFYKSIDALAFPTRYVNEAEPVTVHEALMHAVPVIAYGRGAISEILDGAQGHVVPIDEQFALAAVSVVRDWQHDRELLQAARTRSLACFQSLRKRSGESLRALAESI